MDEADRILNMDFESEVINHNMVEFSHVVILEF